jgi:phage baseplate assembly protein W
MAFRIANKFPIDTEARKAVGVSLPFSGTAVFNSTYTTADQLKSNLINYFMTDPGERYMNPNFGAGLKATIFEQLNEGNYQAVQTKLEADLKRYFPIVELGNVEVYGNEDQNILKIEITYSVRSFGIQDTINILI